MDTINELIKTTEGNLEDLNGAEFNWGTIKIRDAGRIQENILLTFVYHTDRAGYANHQIFIAVLLNLMISTTGKAEIFKSSYATKVSIVTLLVGGPSK